MNNSEIYWGLFEKGQSHKSESTHIESIDVQITFHDLLVDMKTTQKFRNQSKEPVELEYKYRSDCSPHSLTVMLVDPETGKKDTLHAKIHTKEAAVEKYDDSISRGSRAVLMEKDEDQPNLYSLSLGNMKPKMEITIITEVVTSATLETDDGDPDRLNFLYSIPPLTVDGNDESDGEVDEESPNNIMSIKIITQNAESATSPSHLNLLASQESGIWETRVPIGVSEEVELIVSYVKYPLSTFTVSPVSYENYKYAGVLSLIPNFCAQRPGGSELILIIDCSGSMIGERMKCAVEALRLFLQSLDLNRKIKYNIIRFGSNFQKLFKKSVRLRDDNNLKKAQDFIFKTRSNMGGTNMLRPIQSIFDNQKKEEEEEKDPMLKEIEKHVQQNVCTFKATGKRFCVQKWFQCGQCGMTEYQGCCQSCIENCHKGHTGVSEAENSPSHFYCDCESDNPGNCVASKNKFDPEAKLNIEEQEELEEEEEEEEEEDRDVYTKQLFLFTDGEDEYPREIEKLVFEKHKEMGLRVFSFGIGKGINQQFLQNCADLTRGSACFIEDIKEQMISQVLRQLSNSFRASIDNIKIMKGLDIDGKKTIKASSSGSDVNKQLFPQILFNGRSHHEYFFLEEIPEEEVVVKFDFLGVSSEEKVKILKTEDKCVGVRVAHEFIETFKKKKKKKNEEIQNLGLTFNIPTDYTSFFLESETEENVVSEMKVEKVLLNSRRKKKKKNQRKYDNDDKSKLYDDYSRKFEDLRMASQSNPQLLNSMLQQESSRSRGIPISRDGGGGSGSCMGGGLGGNASEAVNEMMDLDINDLKDDGNDDDDDDEIKEKMMKYLRERQQEEGRNKSRKRDEETEKYFDRGELMSGLKSSLGSLRKDSMKGEEEEEGESERDGWDNHEEEEEEEEDFEGLASSSSKEEMKPKGVKESISQQHNLSDLLLMCDMKGIWEVKDEVLRLIGFANPEEFIEFTKPEEKYHKGKEVMKYWLTSIILAILNKFYKSKKSSWRLIARKSMRSVCEKVDENIIVLARKVVKLKKNEFKLLIMLK